MIWKAKAVLDMDGGWWLCNSVNVVIATEVKDTLKMIKSVHFTLYIFYCNFKSTVLIAFLSGRAPAGMPNSQNLESLRKERRGGRGWGRKRRMGGQAFKMDMQYHREVAWGLGGTGGDP